jgi:membrane peptidoglycan carboxypeptidase
VAGLVGCGLLSAALQTYIESVRLPDDPRKPQASVLYYRDGHTVLARVGVTDHNDVPLSEVPLPVRRAVLAAEDRDFYRHGAVSARGVGRAVWANATGDRQGGSTITQQYARNAYLNQERSLTRKAKELALAVKLERRYSKEEILERYLNTIYFGRGAYGIAAAAHAYFGVPPGQLSLAQGAVLAAVIKDPWHFDPAVDAAAARDRWTWIVEAMQDAGWAEQTPRYPPVRARAGVSGPNGLVVDQVEKEVAAHGIPPQLLRTRGLSVVTTLDPVVQAAALDSVAATLRTQPDGLRAALVAVDPATGAVRAYYGGDRGQGYFDDAAAWRPAAATFTPIALAAALRQGIGFGSQWDGSSPRFFPDRDGAPLLNRDGVQCPNCTLEKAMVESLSTPLYALTQRIGAARVRDVAIALGIPATQDGRPSLVDLPGEPRPGRTRADIAIGRYPVAAADLATVYATFAAGGVRSTRHFVESVSGSRVAAPEQERVLDPQVAADVSAVLAAALDDRALALDRPAAGKTGTHQWGNTSDNQDAWLAGYTPQLATAVWLGRSVPGPIRDSGGAPIAGGTVPAELWKAFVGAALRGQPALPFPPPARVGRTDVGDAGAVNPDDPRVAAPRRGPLPVIRTAHAGKSLALTFDDGPSEYTGAVLDILDQYGVKATFCVVGDKLTGSSQILRRVVAAGHALCNHSTHHDDLGTATPDRVRADIAGTDAAIAAAAPGAVVTYFRAPYGNWGASSEVATQVGRTPLGWSVDSEDWKLRGADVIVSTIEAQLRPGSVVLLHDGGGDRRQTLDALRILVPRLQRQGWRFDFPAVTVAPAPVVVSPGVASPSTAPVSPALESTPFPESAPSLEPTPSPEPSSPESTPSAESTPDPSP